MVEKPPPVPPSGDQGSVQGPAPSKDKPHGYHPKPLTWLGMHFDEKQTQMLWNAITQQINSEIKSDQDRMVKAIRKWRNPDNSDQD